jgi:hypothetical protein
VLRVELGLFFEATQRETSYSPHGIGGDIEDMYRVPDKGLVIGKCMPFFVGDEKVVFYTDTVSPLVSFFHVSGAERLIKPIVFDA